MPGRAALLLTASAALLGSATLPSGVLAQTAQDEVLLPQTGLTIDAGAAVRLRPAHLGSDTYVADFVPVIDGQWGKNLHFSVDDGVQYTALRSNGFRFGPDLEYRSPYNDHRPPRSRRTSSAVEAGLFGAWNLKYGELEGRVRKALNGYEGWSADLSFDTLAPIAPKWFVGAEARLGWADRRFAQNQFGATAVPGGRPTAIGDYYTAGAQLALIRQFGPKDRVLLTGSVDQILRPSRAATTTQTRTAVTVLLAYTHRFSW